jgi:hypothetical protein
MRRATFALQNGRVSFLRISASLLALTAFFAVTVLPIELNYFFVVIFVLIALITSINSANFNKPFFFYLFFLVAPSLISIFSLVPSMILNSHGLIYENIDIFGRLVNLLLFPAAILLIHNFFHKEMGCQLFWWYWIGLSIFIAFGMWHAASIYGSFVEFPFDTRSHIHGAGDLDILASKRVTGIAREPSYFVPLVVDFMIITLLVISSLVLRIIYIGIALILIFLALSPSGFLIAGGSLLGAIVTLYLRLLIRKRLKIRYFVSVIFLISIVVIIGELTSDSFALQYIFNRFVGLEMQASDRLFMSIFPFFLSADNNLFSLLFGNGLKTYSIIGTKYSLPSGDPVHVTSNNLYVDMFWESGLIGLFVLTAFFFSCLYKITKSKFDNKQLFIASLILFSLMLSSMVRADFASLRFFIMAYLLYVSINYDLRPFLKSI